MQYFRTNVFGRYVKILCKLMLKKKNEIWSMHTSFVLSRYFHPSWFSPCRSHLWNHDMHPYLFWRWQSWSYICFVWYLFGKFHRKVSVFNIMLFNKLKMSEKFTISLQKYKRIKLFWKGIQVYLYSVDKILYFFYKDWWISLHRNEQFCFSLILYNESYL